MTEELRQEIDYNLSVRDELKAFLSRFKKDGRSIKDVDSELIAIKFEDLEASYKDIAFYILKLNNDGFITHDETKYLAKIIRDTEGFYDDSDELKAAIAKKKKWLSLGSFEEMMSQVDWDSIDEYEYYILEFAALEFDMFIK